MNTDIAISAMRHKLHSDFCIYYAAKIQNIYQSVKQYTLIISNHEGYLTLLPTKMNIHTVFIIFLKYKKKACTHHQVYDGSSLESTI